MRYKDSVDSSRQYLKLALELIGKYGLPTDPLNYCVWYEYASGKNGALNTAVEKYLKDGATFSEDLCQQLFNDYVADGREQITALVHEELSKSAAAARV